MLTISNKPKDQHVIWQKHLSELDIFSKNQLSKEPERRRCSIQQQLDKSPSTKNQLLEIIEGLEIMNDELVDKAKQAKKETSVDLHVRVVELRPRECFTNLSGECVNAC